MEQNITDSITQITMRNQKNHTTTLTHIQHRSKEKDKAVVIETGAAE